jgi:hypothetical protein
LHGVSRETPGANVDFGSKWNKDSSAVGFDGDAGGTTTPASAATRMASAGRDGADATADRDATARGPLKTASCEAIAC